MDDGKIIELFYIRSENAIKETAAKYGGICYKLSFNILNNQRDAEECVNDAYLGLWNAIPPAKPNPFSAFLYKLVRNISLKRYRSNNALKRNGPFEKSMDELELTLPSKEDVESLVDAEELKVSVEVFLKELSKENRIIFIRRYWFFDSYADIAKRMGMSQKNISVRLARVRKELQAFLKERGAFG